MAKAQQFVNQSIAHLRFVDEAWDAACVRIADLPVPRPISGWGVIVSDALSGQILAVEHMESADDDAVVDEIIAAFLQPENGEPRQPLTLRVPDDSLAELLRARLADSPTTIEVAAVPVAIERLTTFLTMVSNAVENEPRLPAASAPAYFRAAAAFYKAKPWLVLEPEQKLRLDFPDTALFAAVHGVDGDEPGLTLYRFEEEFDRVFEDHAETREDDEVDEDLSYIENALSIVYLPERNVSEERREQRRRARWVLAGPLAFPVPVIYEKGGDVRPPVDADLDVLAQAVSAVAGFVARNRKRLARRESCSSRIEVNAPAGKTVVEVNYVSGKNPDRMSPGK